MPAPEWVPRSPDDLLARAKTRGAQLRLQRRSRWLSACIAVLAVAALTVAGASGRDATTSRLAADQPRDDPSTTSADPSPSSSTTTTGDDEDVDRGEEASSTTTTERRSSTMGPSTTAPSGVLATTSTTGAPADRAEFDAPRAGTYRYRVELDGSVRESRVTYTEVGRREGETRLTERWDDSGARPTELSWRDTGVFVPNPSSCEEEGFKTRYVFPLTVGATWTSDNTCSNETTGRVHSRSTARVTDFAKVTVAGQTIDAWVISVTGTTEITIAGVKQTHHSDATEWFSAAHGLRVRSVVQMRSEPGGAAAGPSTSEIQGLDPE